MAQNLEKAFDEEMMNIYRRAKSEAKYTASRFHEMLCSEGGLNTARILINNKEQSVGYTELYLRKRLDLTVEATVIDNPKWYPLFSPIELDKARKRLEANGYKQIK
ncbi:MAG: hypothetical protein IT558_01535 [Alphaproteobacteria bacterium]|nr:hypothetical protein [Alphaproteobacteria bacterium]